MMFFLVGKFERHLASGHMTEGSDFLKVWIAYIDYMRRRVDWEDEGDSMYI